MEREPKKETGGGREEVSFFSLPLPPFTLPIFRALFLCSETTRKRLLRSYAGYIKRRGVFSN